MSIKIKIIKSNDIPSWDGYVREHQQASLYHLSEWKNIIEKTYHHKTYYLMALQKAQNPITPINIYSDNFSENDSLSGEIPPEPLDGNSANFIGSANTVVGILPLVHLKHLIFGDSLISIPFFDFCGTLSDNKNAEITLLNKAVKLAEEMDIKRIEFRNIQSSHWYSDFVSKNPNSLMRFYTKSNKVRMILELPDSSESLMKSFKSKLRSQIKKPLKQGLKTKIGGFELLADFYEVFSIHMKELGSPIHSKKLMRYVLKGFSEKARIVIVYEGDKPVACSLVIGFKDTLENPWASALRKYSRFAPNMLLYWTMLEYACDNNFKYFDFGRSSIDEGTYKFKKQWGAKPEPLYWHYISMDGKPIAVPISEQSSFELAAQVWKKLPVAVTRVIGPMIRKYIGL
jgi:FemAB-related protein (PEP-CTERM system-associated)